MIVDSSALLAVLLREPGWDVVLGKLATARTPIGIGAPTVAEAGLVLTARLGRDGRSLLARFVREAGIVVVPFGEEHARAAIEAFARFGKGRHPAALNFGDCLTYAVALLSRQRLLCVGDDFPRTGLPIA